MKIYVTRHGETEWNVEGKMQGWMNSDLTPKGIDNARKLGRRLKDVEFDAVFASPLGRTMQTAQQIIGDRKLPIVSKEAFKEMGFGLWEGMYHDDVKAKYTEQQYNFWNAPHLYKPMDGAESYEALIERVRKGINEIISDTKSQNVLLVTHAAALKAILAIAYNRTLEDFWAPPFTYDTCLAVLEAEDGNLRVLMEPDIAHLEE